MKNRNDKLFLCWLPYVGLPVPKTEYRFHPTRQWRFDYAWPDRKCALEVEGGVWIGGRHVRGLGFISDMEKYNAAVLLGWRVLRCLPADLCTEKLERMLRAVLTSNAGERHNGKRTRK